MFFLLLQILFSRWHFFVHLFSYFILRPSTTIPALLRLHLVSSKKLILRLKVQLRPLTPLSGTHLLTHTYTYTPLLLLSCEWMYFSDLTWLIARKLMDNQKFSLSRPHELQSRRIACSSSVCRCPLWNAQREEGGGRGGAGGRVGRNRREERETYIHVSDILPADSSSVRASLNSSTPICSRQGNPIWRGATIRSERTLRRDDCHSDSEAFVRALKISPG